MISSFLNTFQIFSTKEIADFEKMLSFRRLKKGDYFIQDGKTCKEVAFLQSGILRSFLRRASGEEFTYCISFPNTLMTAYSSLISGMPTAENIQALVSADLLVIQKHELDQLSASSLNWTRFLKVIAEQQYLEMEKRVFLLQQETAKQRYITLLTNQPRYVQQIPLQYLASYLGITPRHLSRLRKEIIL